MKKSILLLFLAISTLAFSQRTFPTRIGSDKAVIKSWESDPDNLRGRKNTQIGDRDTMPDAGGTNYSELGFKLELAPTMIGNPDMPPVSNYVTCVGYKAGYYITTANYVFLVGSDSTTINYPADKSYFYYFNEEQVSPDLCDCLSKVHPNGTDIPKDRAWEIITLGRWCLLTYTRHPLGW